MIWKIWLVNLFPAFWIGYNILLRSLSTRLNSLLLFSIAQTTNSNKGAFAVESVMNFRLGLLIGISIVVVQRFIMALVAGKTIAQRDSKLRRLTSLEQGRFLTTFMLIRMI